MSDHPVKRRVTVLEVRRKGLSYGGDIILELVTREGSFRTAAGSLASQRLTPYVFPGKGKPANILLNRRGTVDDVGFLD
ncbi:MAG: hypothetical protein E6R04_08620 [Spirochaetes bacterium]|nr:MAG: hypothetical protein E6R04_08620 [Spirochaetota bacterium]